MADKKPLVLLVEPERALSDLIALMLERRGYAVLSVSGLVEARIQLKKRRPMIVILDLFVPDGSGLDLLKEIQTARFLIRPIVVVISSFGFPEIVEQAIQTGARDFILKPFDVDILGDKINALILNKSVDHSDSLAK